MRGYMYRRGEYTKNLSGPGKSQPYNKNESNKKNPINRQNLEQSNGQEEELD
jgi:hypothetical protein